jgi:hypothetical protein
LLAVLTHPSTNSVLSPGATPPCRK